jgi:hypothetical protein
MYRARDRYKSAIPSLTGDLEHGPPDHILCVLGLVLLTETFSKRVPDRWHYGFVYAARSPGRIWNVIVVVARVMARVVGLEVASPPPGDEREHGGSVRVIGRQGGTGWHGCYEWSC